MLLRFVEYGPRGRLDEASFANLIRLDNLLAPATRVPVTDSRHLLTGEGCEAQAENNEMCVKQETFPGYFVTLNGKEEVICAYQKSSHHFVCHHAAKCRKLPDVFKETFFLLTL